MGDDNGALWVAFWVCSFIFLGDGLVCVKNNLRQQQSSPPGGAGGPPEQAERLLLRGPEAEEAARKLMSVTLRGGARGFTSGKTDIESIA